MSIVDDEGMVHFSSENPSEAEIKAYHRETAERIVEKVIDDLNDLLMEMTTAQTHCASMYFVKASRDIYFAIDNLEKWQSGLPE